MSEVNGVPVDASDKYAGNAHLLTAWPADPDGELIGEDIYFGSSPFAQWEKLAPEDGPRPISLAPRIAFGRGSPFSAQPVRPSLDYSDQRRIQQDLALMCRPAQRLEPGGELIEREDVGDHVLDVEPSSGQHVDHQLEVRLVVSDNELH